jgi:outer membrane protein OmpA-like peptidoglycan-associated protein
MSRRLFAAASILALLTAPALAQQQLRQPRPSVEVDWTVLDELGAQGTTPALRAPQRAGQRLVAPPPRAATPAAAPVGAPQLVPPASVARQTGTPTGTRLGPQTQTAQAPTFTPPPPPPAFVPPPAPVASAPIAPAPVAAPPPPPPPPAATQAPPSRIAPAPPPPPAAAIAPPPPAAAPAPSPAPQQTAQAPAARAAGALATLPFAAGASELTDQARAALGPVLEALRGDASARLQIQAFATGGDDQGGQARRLSLSRALAVRSHLIEQGIAATRMDVRALGRTAEGPSDRVDILLVRR